MKNKKPLVQFSIYVCALFLLVGVMSVSSQTSVMPGEVTDPEFGPSSSINVSLEGFIIEAIGRVSQTGTTTTSTIVTNPDGTASIGDTKLSEGAIETNRLALGDYAVDSNYALTTPTAYIGELNLNGVTRNQWPGLTNGNGLNASGLQFSSNSCDLVERGANSCACAQGYVAVSCGGLNAGTRCITDGTRCVCDRIAGEPGTTTSSNRITVSCLRLNY